jgi:transcription-repair coupling factor (superfamily II helicase)
MIAAANLGRAEAVAEEMSFFSNEIAEGARPRILALPPSIAGSEGEFDQMCDLLGTLAALRHEKKNAGAPLVIACSPAALQQPCPTPEALNGRELTLRKGMRIEMRALVEALAHEFGYDHEAVCETPGQFAVRGGIVDVYPLNAEAPVRIDFFGDEIECIRIFDPATQVTDRDARQPDSTVICALLAAEKAMCAGAFVQHLPKDVLWVVVEPEALDATESREIAALCENGGSLAIVSEFDAAPPDALPQGSTETNVEHWVGRDMAALFGANFDGLPGMERLAAEENLRTQTLRELEQRRAAGARVRIVAETEGGAARLRTLVAEAGGAPEDVVTGLIPAGFVLERWHGETALVVATERELSGRFRRRSPAIRQRRLPRKAQVEQLLDFNELADGDLLVHLRHGVCVYRGINRIGTGARNSAKEEMISLEFDSKVTTHLPLREAHLLTRYVGLRKAIPKLGKIGSTTWLKARRDAEAATAEFASDLLSLQARRQSKPGFAFPPDEALPWFHDFERAFPHTETPDQSRAIAETKCDMERPAPMDRLICGDVGYGKTEIALRAAFKAVLGGCQVAILAPTTVLAQQHFNTFRERFAKYPLTVEMLSRFRKPAQRARITAQINDGRVDIVVGTHALLSKTVKFHRLGLLVIDEEHRFGVRQKETIKRLRENVDVLCMSATPIPRTLHLALMGARDLSVIETPPRERLPIRTLVRTYDEKLIRDAISHELGRGGQVFYLHNRIETIESVAARLKEIVPNARFGVGHGKMGETVLEEIMTRFVSGGFDVLVCTTIIETGLDIPNCNTLIIEGADRFGLAQLYQLRGRVGRFNRQAYAYLLLHKNLPLLDPARKRLSAIRQHDQLGAGLRIAIRDLELRGTGNLLGREQSGHIASIGFDLYCQLLRQNVARLKGEPFASSLRCEVRLDFTREGTLSGSTDDEPETETATESHAYRVLRNQELDDERCETVDATLPADYITDVRLRIDMFRKIAMASTPDTVAQIEADMVDRFGKLPPPAAAFVSLAAIRCIAESRGVISVETEGNRLKCKRLRTGNNNGAGNDEFIKLGANFPHLTHRSPLRRLREIKNFLLRQPPFKPAPSPRKTPPKRQEG